MLTSFPIDTPSRTCMLNIDNRISDVVAQSGITEGLCVIWVPHTTAGVTVNENADPNVVRDILAETEKIVPLQDGYHHMEGNSAAHIKSSLFRPSLTILITSGRLLLGTWQSIFFCEFDGPRTRKVFVKIVEG